MPKQFQYQATDSEGKTSNGTIEANDRDQAMALLARRDLVVSDLREVHEKSKKGSRPVGHVGVQELASFSYELSALLGAGVTLAQALELQVKDDTGTAMDAVVLDLLRQVRSGTPFSNAIESHPDIFPPIYSSLVRSGEGTGNIDKALLQLSDFFEKIDQVRSRVISAMSYPVVVSGMALFIITCLFAFMVPRFKQIYAQIGVPVPPVTAAVLLVGTYADEALLVLVALVFLGTPLMRRYLASPSGRRMADRLKLRIPLVGSAFEQMALANFSKTLALLHANGVNLRDGVDLAAAASGNTYLQDKFRPTVASLTEGRSLSSSLEPTGFFSRKMLGMLEAGEKSGNLSEMLMKMAEFAENRTEHRVERMMALLEPVTIGFIGILVGTAVLTLGGPLMSISGSIQQQ